MCYRPRDHRRDPPFQPQSGAAPARECRIYQARFQMEFLFRYTKQHLGVTPGQAGAPPRLHFHCNAVITALSLVKLQLRNLKQAALNHFSLADVTLQAHNTHRLERFMATLAPYLDRVRFKLQLQALRNYGLVGAAGT